MKPRIGILWNQPAIAHTAPVDKAEAVYRNVGHNTGNMAFVEGIRTLLGPDTPLYAWMSKPEIINEQCDLVVFPAANQLGSHTELGDLAEQFARIQVPILVLGLGAQARSENEAIQLTPGTRRWLDVLMDRGTAGKAHVVVRGAFTHALLESLGYGDRAVVGGCPSQFINPAPGLGGVLAARSKYERLQRLAVASSHYSWGWAREIENELVAYMEARNGSYVTQAPLSMIRAGLGDPDMAEDPEFEKVNRFLRPDLPASAFATWCRTYVHAFSGVYPWMQHLRRHDFTVGTRIHGINLGIQAGVPGFLLAFDTRTRELADAMGVPSIHPSEVKGSVVETARRALSTYDYSQFTRKRSDNATVYREVLTGNGVPYQETVLSRLIREPAAEAAAAQEPQPAPDLAGAPA